MEASKNKKVIYQILTRLFHSGDETRLQHNGSIHDNGCGHFSHLNDQVLQEIHQMGVTDIWLTGVLRHASEAEWPGIGIQGSHPDLLKGRAGSPYAIKDYYDIQPDLADQPSFRMQEFQELVSRAKNHQLGVIIDFVPNHVARDYQSIQKPPDTPELGENDQTDVRFHPDNNFYYLPGEELVLPGKGRIRKKSERFTEFPAKVSGNDVFHSKPEKNDWYETIKLNYGYDYTRYQSSFYPIPDTWIRMLEILDYWAAKEIAGFRCDMAGMVPVEFWSYAISAIKTRYPAIIFIAEIYEPAKYEQFIHAGFDYLYDKDGLYDTLRAVMTGQLPARDISRVWQNLNGLDDRMLRFLENHDEQRIASPQFCGDPWKGLPGMAVSCLMNSGPVLLYFGQEFGEEGKGSPGFSGQDGRTSIFDYTLVPSISRWLDQTRKTTSTPAEIRLKSAYISLLLFAARNPVFSKGQLYDLMWMNDALPPEVKDQIFSFMRYYRDEIYLVTVTFDNSIKEIRIKIGEHAFQTMGVHPDRIQTKELHPGEGTNHLLFSQVTDQGILVRFDQTGWSVIKLTC